jgi:N-acylglucosamine 2-epimerase
MSLPISFAALRDQYRSLLLDNVVPYWAPHMDWEHGGILNCIRDDGALVSDDKYMWSQLRALWVYSKLYNVIERRQDWLDIAANIYRFVAAHGRDAQGNWVYHVTRDGRVVEGANSIYADGFAIYALAEYYRATGDLEARSMGLQTCERALAKLAAPGSYQTAPYVLPEGMKCHGVSMIFSLVFWEFGRAIGDPSLVEQGYKHTLQVMDSFRRPELQALLEYITLDDRVVDSPVGRCIVPGHAIECMWFQMHILQQRGAAADHVAQAIECIRWHLERGWDPEYGGILLGIDLKGVTPPYWENAEVKAWWPHTEALYALLLAYEQCREPWCLDWYWRVHQWTFEHYPDREHGEWYQRLDRNGEVLNRYIALPVKDPFHLPRAVIYLILLLERLAAE